MTVKYISKKDGSILEGNFWRGILNADSWRGTTFNPPIHSNDGTNAILNCGDTWAPLLKGDFIFKRPRDPNSYDMMSNATLKEFYEEWIDAPRSVSIEVKEEKTITTPLKVAEKSRTYHYPDKALTLTFENVVAVGVSASGNHRLETTDGKKHIVLKGFIAISIDTPEWSF